MKHKAQEWLRQAEYDLDTAQYMLEGGRNFYAVFMCHLGIEKALKGLYHGRLGTVPPRVHNLVYLLNALDLKPPPDLGKFVVRLNEANIATRYPESLEKVRAEYGEAVTLEILANAKKVLRWIREQL